MDGITDSMEMSLSKLQEVVEDQKAGVLQSMGSQRVRHDLVTGQLLGLHMAVTFLSLHIFPFLCLSVS